MLYFTKKGKPKAKSSKIKLTNTLQQSKNKRLDVTADYLIIIDTLAMAAAAATIQGCR